ncbi:MAG: haloacid dehalogenase type II [Thermoplasmata archaeon]
MEKFVTFDCYGTLIDWKKGISESFRRITGVEELSDEEIFREYVSLEAEEERGYAPYRLILEKSFISLAMKFNVKVTTAQAKDFSSSMVKWPPFFDTVSALEELGNEGFVRVILSNVDRDLLEQTIANSGMEIDGFVTAEDVGSYKPNAAHWLYFFKHFNASRENSIHVAGSLYHDIEPARKLGLKTIWVNRYGETPGSNPPYNLVISSLIELPALLREF